MKKYAFLDMEGVLYPELWEIYAEKLGLPQLAKTTRQEPDFSKLMEERISLLAQNGIRLAHLSAYSDEVRLLEGAADFVAQLKRKGFEIHVVTDAFAEIIGTALEPLAVEAVHTNYFECNADGLIRKAVYTHTQGKHEVLAKIVKKGDFCIAVGDTFNDFSMLQYADKGFLFRPSAEAGKHVPDGITVTKHYSEILAVV